MVERLAFGPVPATARATALATALALAACGGQAMLPDTSPPAEKAVAPDVFAALLERYVDIEGKVDFTRWKASAADVAALDAYAERLLARPPHRFPKAYATGAAELAYWLNLYNALALREILARWPLASLADVPSGGAIGGSGKGLLHDVRFDVGGTPMSLLDIEAHIARTRFADPRAHFAVSCGARSCALVPRAPFDGVSLDRRLDDAARAFINRRGNVRVDDDGRRVLVAALIGWYEDELVAYLGRRLTTPAPSLMDLLLLYADGALAQEVRRAKHAHYRIELLPYDWRVASAAPPAVEDLELTGAELIDPRTPLPDLDLELLDGTRFRSAEARGKVLLLDFWATWCRPCLWSFSRYADLQLAHEKRGLTVVAVSQDAGREAVLAFAASGHQSLTIALDPTLRAAEPPLSIATLPTVLLVDRQGLVRFREEGYGGAGYAALERKLEELLSEPPP
jgi:thiol-disulfide isomerase/thioredoxin